MRQFKNYLYDIHIAFGIIASSYSILTTISIFSLSLSFGIFVYNTNKILSFSRIGKIATMFVIIFVFTFFVYLFSWMLFLSGDTKTNPGKKCNLNNHPTIYHWNLNNLSAHNFAKVQLSKAYLAVHKFDIECFSGTYLNSCFPFYDEILYKPGYIIARGNRPVKSKCGGVCTYCKNCLPLNVLNIKFPHEHIAFDLQSGDLLYCFSSVYR